MAKLHHPHAGLLIVRSAKQTMIPLVKDVTTIGRKQADIILDDAKASGTHAEIRRDGNRFFLVDLQSTNGTYVNRKPVTKHELSDQDVIEVGLTTLCFFADAREFHGREEEAAIAGAQPKAEPTKTRKVGDSVTSTETIPQTIVQISIVDGPNKGKSFRFKKSHITLGRNDTDLVLLDPDVSRNHAMLEVFGKNAVFLRDLGSTNGTFLNGKKIQTEKVSSGDEISIGNSRMEISFDNSLVEER